MKTIHTVSEGNWVVADNALAVAAQHYPAQALELASIHEFEIDPDLIRPLAEFAVGDEILVQSPDEGDCGDAGSDDAAAVTRIWFLGTIRAESARPER
jgi:hypothetical protein